MLWLVIREAMILILAGAILGVPLAYAAGRGIASLLFGVGPLDVIAYVAAAGLLMLAGGFATFIPAHRASRVDPVAALRAE